MRTSPIPKMKGDEYECDQCWKSYHTEDLLQRHIRKIHVGPRWRCPDCDYSADYSDRPGLRRHLQLDHHYSKEEAMDKQFEQVKPRKRTTNNNNNIHSNSNNNKRGRSPSPMNRSEPDRKNRSLSLSPRRRSISAASSEDRHHPTVKSVIAAIPTTTTYPSQVSSQVSNKPEGIKAVWSGVVPKGTSITHLGVPQPVIERHFIQADDDTILVKEVFLFQAPTHWSTFKDSKFEVVTPSGSTSTSLNGESSSPIEGTSNEEKMVDDIVITVNGQENEEL